MLFVKWVVCGGGVYISVCVSVRHQGHVYQKRVWELTEICVCGISRKFRSHASVWFELAGGVSTRVRAPRNGVHLVPPEPCPLCHSADTAIDCLKVQNRWLNSESVLVVAPSHLSLFEVRKHLITCQACNLWSLWPLHSLKLDPYRISLL